MREEKEKANFYKIKTKDEGWEICPDCGGVGEYKNLAEGTSDWCKLCEGTGIVYPYGQA